MPEATAQNLNLRAGTRTAARDWVYFENQIFPEWLVPSTLLILINISEYEA